MERENLLQAREEFVRTLEVRVMKRRKVHPFDKQAFFDLMQEEIKSYKAGLIDRLTSNRELADLLGVHINTVLDYQIELPSGDLSFRRNQLLVQNYQKAYEAGLGRFTAEDLKESRATGGRQAYALYGSHLKKLTPEERKLISTKGGKQATKLYGPPGQHLTHEQRVEYGRKGGLCSTKEGIKLANDVLRESLRKKQGFLILEMVKPLVIRSIPSKNIAEIIGLSVLQVRNTKHYLKKKQKRNKKESLQDRKRVSYIQEKQTIEREKCIALARDLLKVKLFTITDRYWNRLQEIRSKLGFGASHSLAEQLCLESFLVARMYAETAERDPKKGNREYLERYIKCGMRIDSTWFKTKLIFYEGFLKEAIYLLKQTS